MLLFVVPQMLLPRAVAGGVKAQSKYEGAFQQRVTVLRTVLAIAFNCLPLTRHYCIKTNERRMMPSSQLGSAMYLAFGDIKLINIFAKD